MKLTPMETGLRFMVPTTNNISETSNLKLSIQVSLSGLSFCVLNIETQTIEYLKVNSFDKKLNPKEVMFKIQSYFESEKPLQQKFSTLVVIHKNELSTIVPLALFNEDNLADYLKFNNKILSTDFITFDTININDSANVYIPFVNINNFLYERFGEFTFKHFSTILVEQILNAEKNSEKPKMYVNISDENFEITVVEKGKLKLYNSFEFKTKEDFIYYILFTAEQLKLNPETFELIFTGNIDSKDELYSIAYKYVRFVFFSKRIESYKYSDQAQPENNHSQFVILNSF
jgi:hypothetical protein